MGLSRRFLNVIVDNRIQGAKSLRCIDLRRHKLFNTRTLVLPPPLKRNRSGSDCPPQDDRKNHRQGQAAASLSSIRRRKIREIQLPQPTMNFQCSIVDTLLWNMKCLPLAGRKLLCVDAFYRTVLFDVNTRQVETIPYFHVPKNSPLPCFVPLPSSVDADAAADGNGSFYILEGSPYHEKLQGDDGARQKLSIQYEAFVYNSESRSWHRQLLPPPPFVYDPEHYMNRRDPEITSYAVIERGGSHVVYISADGADTYCLDTVTHKWSHVGDWVLPFTGKVEYVPELKLWSGICTEGLQLGAADLSAMDDSQSQPQLVGTWKELEAPGEWRELMLKPPQLVSLGSGRFCIARFFFQALPNPLAFYDYYSDDCTDYGEYFTVLTGIDVVPRVHDAHATASDTSFSGGDGSRGKVELQMIKHNSRRHISSTCGSDGDSIEEVF